MSRFKIRGRKLALAALLGSGLLTAGIVLAEDVWVSANSVDIRAGMGAIYPVIHTAAKGEKLTVIDHEGKWIKVQTKDAQGNDAEGYVFENAISPRAVGGSLDLSGLAAGNAGNLDTSAGGKGLNEDAEQYASSKKIDSKPLNDLIDRRKKIDPKLWEQFVKDGKVGPYAQ